MKLKTFLLIGYARNISIMIGRGEVRNISIMIGRGEVRNISINWLC